ncbi:MAG: hypothetical protein ACM3JG_02795 [Thiohalocapsa sp.]
MTRRAALLRELAERLRRKELTSLIYFHTDHFEPWREIGARVPAVGQGIVDSIGDFRRTSERIDFARRLTLFYKPHLNYDMRPGDGLFRAHPEDLVGFLPRSEEEEHYGRMALQELVAHSAHEIQLHIHHEYYTATNGHTDPRAIEWFASPLGRSLDEGRLELAIRLNREIIGRETGAIPERWFFVHGHWALNASDDSSCTITNEIAILLRNGCRGDFTFPAGRLHVNPRIKVPYLCRPVNEPKGYDMPAAEPEIAYGNGAAAADKFFLWSAAASGHHCSIDYMSESVRAHLENTQKAAVALIEGSYADGGQLFVKTHAHSMHPAYFTQARSAVFPHQYPAVQTLLSTLFDAAELAGLTVRFHSASEVYDLVVGAAHKPAVDLAASYLAPPSTATAKAAALRSATAANGAARGLRVANPRFRAAAVVELVRETVADVLQERIDRLGTGGSGADEHYALMLRRGVKLPDFNLAALDIVRRRVPRLRSYHEIGSGIGILPFLLALNGFPAVGIECDKRRHATAAAIWQELSTRAAVPQRDCRLILGSFPQAMARADLSHSIAILTDFVTENGLKQREQILTGLRRYRFVLLDLQRFCVLRETRERQLELLDELHTIGFRSVHKPNDPTNEDFALALFENAPTTRPRPTAWSRLERLWRPSGTA